MKKKRILCDMWNLRYTATLETKLKVLNDYTKSKEHGAKIRIEFKVGLASLQNGQ